MREALKRVVENFFPKLEFVDYKTLEGGFSSEVFLIELRSEDEVENLVLRTEGGPPAENSIKTEFDLLNILHSRGIPCPKPLFLDTSCKTLDKRFMLMSYLKGEVDIPNSDNLSFIEEMVRKLRYIHETKTDSLPNLNLRINPLDNLFEYLPVGKNWDKLKNFLLSIPDTEYTGNRMLLHGDFWPGNILWKNNKIVGIVDWEYAAIGDPFSDLAVTSLDLRYSFGVQGMKKLLEIYSDYLPIDRFRYSLWLIYVASSTLYFMDEWNLEKKIKSIMAKEAMATIEEESYFLLNS